MAKTLKRPSVKISKASLPKHVERYLQAKEMADEAAARVKQQRDSIIAFAAENGVEDSQGHQWVNAGEFQVKREKRVSVSMDEEYVEDWLKENKMWDRCTATLVVIDEDALYAAIYDGDIPEEVADNMFAKKESYALKVSP